MQLYRGERYIKLILNGKQADGKPACCRQRLGIWANFMIGRHLWLTWCCRGSSGHSLWRPMLRGGAGKIWLTVLRDWYSKMALEGSGLHDVISCILSLKVVSLRPHVTHTSYQYLRAISDILASRGDPGPWADWGPFYSVAAFLHPWRFSHRSTFTVANVKIGPRKKVDQDNE